MKCEKDGFCFKIKRGLPKPLGATKTHEGMNLAVAVPDDRTCSLVLYEKGSKEPCEEISFSEGCKAGDIYFLMLADFDCGRYEYNYRIDGKIVQDPYAAVIAGREHWGIEIPAGDLRCGFLNEDYDWEGDRPLEIPFEEIVMYCIHPRGFTRHSSSNVKEKGTFSGIAEKIPYLKELGINQIEMMPVYEFDEMVREPEDIASRIRYLDYKGMKQNTGNMDPSRNSTGYGWPVEEEKAKATKINYWGYGPGFYFAPKASYSGTGNPEREFKDMVKALHRNGIEIVMEFYFAPGTPCSLLMDCLEHWAMEYHVDGFHVNGEAAPMTTVASSPIFSKTKIMWAGASAGYGDSEGRHPSFRHIADYNDSFMIDARRFLKGDDDHLNKMAYRIRRNPSKEGVINYLTSHNGFTLMDLVSYDEKHNEANGEGNNDGMNVNYSWNCGAEGKTRKKKILEIRKRQIKNGLVLVLLSQGVPMLLGGDEMGHTQGGNNNAYCQDNTSTWIDWKDCRKNSEILEFVQKLISFRKAHRILHMPAELKIMDHLSCGYPDLSYHGEKPWYPDFGIYARQIGLMYCGKYAVLAGEKEDDFLYVAYNMHWEKHEFAMPKLPKGRSWKVAVDTGAAEGCGIYPAGSEPVLENQRLIEIKPRTIAVLIGN